MMYSRRTRPSASVVICSRRALRAARAVCTTPMWSGGMSTVIRSYGSSVSPSMVRRITSGRLTCQLVALAPHLLDQHRQLELAAAADLEHVLGEPVGANSIETLPSTSFSSRARIWRVVRHLPVAARQAARCSRRTSSGASARRRRAGAAAAGSAGSVRRVADRRPRAGPATDDDVPRSGVGHVDPVDAVRRLERGHRAVQGDRPAGLDGAGRVVGLLAHDRDPLAGSNRPVAGSGRRPSAPRSRWPTRLVTSSLERVPIGVDRRCG